MVGEVAGGDRCLRINIVVLALHARFLRHGGLTGQRRDHAHYPSSQCHHAPDVLGTYLHAKPCHAEHLREATTEILVEVPLATPKPPAKPVGGLTESESGGLGIAPLVIPKWLRWSGGRRITYGGRRMEVPSLPGGRGIRLY